MTVTLLRPSSRASAKIGPALTARVVRAEAARTVVALQGEADASTTAVLSQALSQVIASRAGSVVIDLDHLTFIDSASVRVIATAHHLLASQGRTLFVRAPSRLATRVLDLFGLAALIQGPDVA
jgi:anti-anti-sigma factor